jgi:hypothetical protein
MTKLNEMHEQEVAHLANLRHKAHVAGNFDDWNKAIRGIHDMAIDELSTIPDVDYIECKDEECFGLCDACEEAETEFLDNNKEEVNTLIEELLREYDKANNTELAPTGLARHRWVMSC